jgi:hypothetical protein
MSSGIDWNDPEINAALEAGIRSLEMSECATQSKGISLCSHAEQVDYWSKAMHEAAQRLHDLSVQLQAHDG